MIACHRIKGMKKNNRSRRVNSVGHKIKILLVIILLNGFMFANAYANGIGNPNGEGKYDVRGTIVGIILTETLNGSSFLILQLDDGKKYRLRPQHGLGFIVGSDVELETGDTYEEDEISLLYKEMIYVNNINVTAMAIPGTKKKVKHPPTNPPEILIQSEEVLKKIEEGEFNFKEHHLK